MRCLGKRERRKGDRRAQEGNTVPLMEALLQHLLMYLLLLQEGNASCGKEQRAPPTSALPIPSTPWEGCSALQCNSSKHSRKKIATGQEEEGLSFCGVGTTCFSLSQQTLLPTLSQALQ